MKNEKISSIEVKPNIEHIKKLFQRKSFHNNKRLMK